MINGQISIIVTHTVTLIFGGSETGPYIVKISIVGFGLLVEWGAHIATLDLGPPGLFPWGVGHLGDMLVPDRKRTAMI